MYCPLNGLFNFFAPNNGFAGLTCRDKYKLHSPLQCNFNYYYRCYTARLEFDLNNVSGLINAYMNLVMCKHNTLFEESFLSLPYLVLVFDPQEFCYTTSNRKKRDQNLLLDSRIIFICCLI